MGKGDQRTKKGKIFHKSHGKTRPHKRPSTRKAAKKTA
jgi:ribosomal small subunit protein bTHX